MPSSTTRDVTGASAARCPREPRSTARSGLRSGRRCQASGMSTDRAASYRPARDGRGHALGRLLLRPGADLAHHAAVWVAAVRARHPSPGDLHVGVRPGHRLGPRARPARPHAAQIMRKRDLPSWSAPADRRAEPSGTPRSSAVRTDPHEKRTTARTPSRPLEAPGLERGDVDRERGPAHAALPIVVSGAPRGIA